MYNGYRRLREGTFSNIYRKDTEMICQRCHTNKSQYTVVSPICMNSINIRLCPSCFQEGIDREEIVWLGNEPYGICAECEEEDATSEAG